MKFLILTIRPSLFDLLKPKLSQLNIHRYKFFACQGNFGEDNKTAWYRGGLIDSKDDRRIRVEMALADEKVKPIIKALKSLRTDQERLEGSVDGIFFLIEIEDILDLTTGTRGNDYFKLPLGPKDPNTAIKI